MPRATVIIVNHNAGALLARCVAALAAQTCAEFEAVIVDNASTDGSLDGLPTDDRFRVIEAGENLGFAAANNLGAKGSTADWIVTLNPDAFAEVHWLERLLRAAQRHPRVAMLGSTQIMADDPARFDGAGDEYSAFGIAYRARYGHPLQTLTEDYPVFGPCAAAAAYRRDAWERAGGFDERFFCYHEDVDLALRLRRMGHRAVQVHDARVHHVGSALTGEASPFAVYHGTRNRVWTWAKSMPAGLAIALLPLTVAANLAYLFWSLARPGRFKPTARGLWHGLRGVPAMVRSRPRSGPGTVRGMLVWSPAAVLRRANKARR